MLEYAFILVPVLLLLFGVMWFLSSKSSMPVPTIAATIIAASVICGVFVPASYSIAKAATQNSAVSGYNEHWNGWERDAFKKDTECYRDGFCRHTYQCDPYTVMVTKTRSVSDGQGGTRTESYQVPETRWHDCPYSTQETDYIVDTTLGKYTVAKNVMTGKPFRFGRSIPGGQQGDPQFWTEVKKRTDANKAEPVVKVSKYDNFLLSAQIETYAHNESNIESLHSAGLLPELSTQIHGLYSANKLYSVQGAGDLKYQDDVSRLNGAFGTELQGDLHVVFVPSDIPVSQTDYMEALIAYWQSKEMGKQALSKNTVVVALGVNDDEVVWAEARTGMPVGNEGLIVSVRQDMPGTPLDQSLFGSPSYDISADKIVHTDGALENLLWGEHAYERVSMSGDDADDIGMGFKYLRDSIQPSMSRLWVYGALTVLLAGGAMFGALIGMSKVPFLCRSKK